jgi:hypothetical protein
VISSVNAELKANVSETIPVSIIKVNVDSDIGFQTNNDVADRLRGFHRNKHVSSVHKISVTQCQI